jgi:Flp pilus assembly protein TadG
MTFKAFRAARLRTFFKSDRGNIAMMFALSLIPLMIGAGAGLDFARAMLVRQQMAEALDAAALAVGSTTGLTRDTAQALAQKYFNANYTVDKTDYGTPTITIPGSGFDSKGSVTVTATDSMPTVLVKLIGINTLPITTSSNVVWGQTNLWVALVLDNSGSMTNGDTSGSKMSALKSAITGTNGLLSILQNATSGGGEAKVSIVPFVNTVNVGTANAGASWIDWQNWECQPQKVSDGYDCKDPIQVSDAVYSGQPLYAFGPGDSCPFTSSYFCAPSAANDGSCTAYKDGNGNRVGDCVDNIPSTGSYSGYICPSMHIANSSGGVNWHYYNGCWVPAGSTTVINTGSSANCNGYTSTTCGCVYSPGTTFFGIAAKTYACIINPTILGTGSSATCDGHSTSSNCGCVTSPNGGIFNIPAGTNVCLAKVWNLTWTANNHSSWGGCVRDRWQNYDIANTTPSSAIQHSQFQAVNNYYCSSAVTPLTNVWTTLSAQVNAMVANGATNQAIGMAHGWQTLTPGDPYGPGDVPDNTTRYIILFSDGLNTMARWYGDGGTEGTTLDGYIDAREKATCDAAKADGIVIYAIYVSIGNTSGNSAPLQYCASDATKYYTLTSTTAITTTFQQIAQQISNLRVVK